MINYKKLVPESEVLHIAVAIILAYVVVEQSTIQKCGKLSENIFILKHSCQFFLAAKLQNQVRFIAKYCIKDYNSTVSKIELPFFIGLYCYFIYFRYPLSGILLNPEKYALLKQVNQDQDFFITR